MNQISVGLSGASSFTGIWIARELAAHYEVEALLSQSGRDSYQGLKKMRLDLLSQNARTHFSVRAEDGSMAEWILKNRPQIWIHHHHHMDDFRSPSYDQKKASNVGLAPLESIVKALAASGCQGVIFSGSYFEPGEGGEFASKIERTPYAVSKKKVWDELGRLCQAQKIPLSKVVIPNPVGSFENEDRVIPLMVQKSGGSMQLHSPESVSDNVSVWELARVYRELVQLLLGEKRVRIARPSSWVASAREFAQVANLELLVKSLGVSPCRVEETPNGKPPTHFENVKAEKMALAQDEFWLRYASELKKARYLVKGL